MMELDVLRAELERLFDLDELLLLSQDVLGFDPQTVGGTSTLGSFAGALVGYCQDVDALEALSDAILVTKPEVDRSITTAAAALAHQELEPGQMLGHYEIVQKLGDGRLGTLYLARRGDHEIRLRVLAPEATRDRRGLHRYLTITRLVGQIDHPGLPRLWEAGPLQGRYVVAHAFTDTESLAARMARRGPLHFDEACALLEGVVKALGALHARGLAHGDVSLDNIAVSRSTDNPVVLLLEAGSDRFKLRVGRSRVGLSSTGGSPKSVSPEQIQGADPDVLSDLYSLGAVMYELLTGRPAFSGDVLETAFGHLQKEPAPPSSVAPRGWLNEEVDRLILGLLAKDPTERPSSAEEVLAELVSLRGAPETIEILISDEELDALERALLSEPDNAQAASELEKAVEQGADPAKVAGALYRATGLLDDDQKSDLLRRAAQLFERSPGTLERAEETYEELLALDPGDTLAASALEELRRRQGKFDEVIEMLLLRAEAASTQDEKARAMAEIGRVYARELNDVEQAVVAYCQALGFEPRETDYAHEIERLAGGNEALWTEVLSSLSESSQEETLSSDDKNLLYLTAAEWYQHKLSRPDLALPCLNAVLAADPTNERALARLGELYRTTQNWAELGLLLTRRAEAAKTPAGARDLRAEAAEILEKHIGDVTAATALYEQVLAEDPGHVRASEARARLYEQAGDYTALAALLERRSSAQRGSEQLRTLCQIAELYADRLGNPDEALRRYRDVIDRDPGSPDALKGLERVLTQTGRYKELLESFESQLALDTTPKQRVILLERIADIYEEEFLNHHAAASALERALETDSGRVSAMATLTRHYRVLGRWSDAADLYERQLELVEEPKERITLAMALGRVLGDQLDTPERAALAYEKVLEIEPEHAGALEALARLRERSGDADAALGAILALADQATTPEARAEQFSRAAKLLDERGARDAAIEHYKLALDANPKDKGASAALRAAYAARGDVQAAIELIERELERTEGERAQAKLAGEMARLLHDKVGDDERAEQAGRRAVKLDPSNLDALRVLGDIAFDGERFVEASAHYGRLADRADVLGREEAIFVLTRYVDASSRAGSAEKALSALDTLLGLAPDDREILGRVAEVTFEHGSPARAVELLEEYLTRFETELTESERAQSTYYLGVALGQTDQIEAAERRLEEACELDPSLTAPLVALAELHVSAANWPAVLSAKSRHLDLAGDDERADLLIEIGEITARLGDKSQAAKSYVTALELRPDDRNLLTKLMQLYSEEKEWDKLVEVVLKLARFVDDPAQKVKYLHTAAMVTARQLENPAQASIYFDQVLALEPGNLKALDEYINLTRNAGSYDTVAELLNRRAELARDKEDKALELSSYDDLAEVYETKLVDYPSAIGALEAAIALSPDDEARALRLAKLYEADAESYLGPAVALQEKLLSQDPFRHESYKALRKIYTANRHADASWCLCQTLTVLGLAGPDEERFYSRMRADTAAPAQEVFSEEDWSECITHPDANSWLTALFSIIEPAVVAARAQALEQYGFTPEHRIDPSAHHAPMAQTLFYAAGVLGIQLPAVYENRADRGGLSFLPTAEPSLVLGRVALSSEVPPQVAAFVAARQLTYYRPGFYLRHFITTGTGLKSWLFAALKMTSPQFPITPDVEGPVTEALATLRASLNHEAKEHLSSVVSKLLTSGTALDLKRWVAAVDLTADRAGFVAAHDLEAVVQVIQASEEGSAAISNQERYKELILYSASSRYFDLRRRLGITIDS